MNLVCLTVAVSRVNLLFVTLVWGVEIDNVEINKLGYFKRYRDAVFGGGGDTLDSLCSNRAKFYQNCCRKIIFWVVLDI